MGCSSIWGNCASWVAIRSKGNWVALLIAIIHLQLLDLPIDSRYVNEYIFKEKFTI
jgi:hypothetical protein